MNCYDIVGWEVVDGQVVCPDCEPKKGCKDEGCIDPNCCPQPIFADTEWDYTPICADCGERLDVRLTDEGVIYEAENQNVEIWYESAQAFLRAEADSWQAARLAEETIVQPDSWEIGDRKSAAADDLEGWYYRFPESDAHGPYARRADAAYVAIEEGGI